MPALVRSIPGVPLRVEHCTAGIGQVLSAWAGSDGRVYALAEIDTSHVGGATAAAFVKSGNFQDFSLGYVSKRLPPTGDGRLHILPGHKRMRELSLCRRGARPGCHILRTTAFKPAPGATEAAARR